MHNILVKSLWHNSPLLSEIKTESTQVPQFQSLFSLVSCGTERLVRNGKIPVSLHDKMKVPFQEGGFNFPIKYGYSLVAKDESGAVFHTMHPHQSFISRNCSSTPTKLPAKRATLISNGETALNAIWDAELTSDSTVAVIGGGLIGMLTAKFARSLTNVPVWIDEKSDSKKEKIRELGFALLEDETEFTHVFHCSASESGLQKAIDIAGHEGKIIELSWYGDKSVNISLGESFHYGRKKIISSQVSHIPLKLDLEHSYETRKKLVMDLLEDDWFDQLLTKTISLEEAPNFFDSLCRGESNEIGVVIQY